MGSNSKVVSGETNPQLNKPFLSHTLHHCVENVLVGPGSVRQLHHLHHLRLCVIKRQTQEGTKEPAHTSGHDSDLEGVFLDLIMILQPLLHLIERSQHSEVQHHGSHHGGPTALPEGGDPFFFDDPSEGVSKVFVVSLLLLWEGLVSLQSHKNKICWVSAKRPEEARGDAEDGFVLNGNPSVLGFVVMHQGSINSHPGGGVSQLTHQSRVKSSIELHKSASVTKHLPDDGEGGDLSSFSKGF